MPDLRQALKDFVATSNSGKYQDEKTLLSKFPELSGYNINVLKDFVATSNSGKYATEDELFAKFPEFNLSSQKKSEFAEDTSSLVSGSGDGSLEPAKLPKLNLAVSGPEYKTATQPKKEYVEPKPDEQGYLLNAVSALDKGFYKNIIGNPIKGLGTALEGATGKAFLSDALIRFGDYFNNAIDELTPQDEEFKNSLTDQFGQAFGQVASMIVTAGAGGVAGKALGMGGKGAAAAAEAQLASQMAPAAGALEAGKTFGSTLFSPSSVSAGLSMGQAEFDRAKQAGATDEQAFEAFYKNAAVGSVLEQIPVMQFMKRFNKATAGGLVDYIKNKSVAGLTGGVEEMTTEVLQQLYANKSAQDIYNINQDLFEGVGESGGIGFGVGFLLNAMGANVKLLRQSGRNQEADIVEAQMKELEGRAQKGGPSSYTLNGIKIDAPVVEDMINTMTAADLAKANIEITNDPELKMKMQNKIVTSSIKEQVREANPDLNEESLDAITELEKELRKFEGNTTQSGKDRAAAIRQQIRDIQETPLPAKVDETVARDTRIAEIEAIAPEDMTTELETELQTLKTERDAVQELSTDESMLRTEQPQMGLQEVGEGNQEPQVTPEGTQEVVTPKEKVKPNAEIFFDEMDTVFPNDHILGGYAATDSEGKLLGRILMSQVDDNTVKIDEIVSEKRGERTGNGSAIMRIVTEYADKNNVKITLTPNIIGEMKAKGFETPQKLQTFYEKFGFVKDKGKATMTRLPIEVAPQPVSLKTQPEVFPTATSENLAELEDAYNAFNDYLEVPRTEQSPNDKRAVRRSSKKAFQKLKSFLGFDIGNVDTLDEKQLAKRDAFYFIKSLVGLEDRNKYENFNELYEDYKKDKSNNVESDLTKSVDILFGIEPVSLKTQQRVVVAPFFNTMATTQEEAAAVRQSPEYKAHLDMLNNLATQMGLEVEAINENIGGYENENKEEVVEISNTVFLNNATIEQAEEYAALAAALTPQVQESSIAAQYVEQGAENHNANEYTWNVSDINGAIKALKSAKITNFTVDENAGTITFFDVFEFADDNLADKFVKLAIELEKNNVDYEVQSFRPVESRYIGKGDRKKVIKRLREKGTELGQIGQGILQTIDQSVKRDAEFRGISTEEYFKPERGNRLFNERLKGVADIANRYFKRIFGLERPQYYGQRKIDKDFAKRISDAFIAMKHDPNNPEVKAAYEALAKETKDQYQAFLDAGYRVEINNEEPYANSQDMIDDLRDNKRIKIFSTESGFGDNPITPQQRAENPLLQPSGFSDANGQPLLVNDLFRAIHDFFGHSELGNSFGPIGEENAWQVHARMFSPIARKAMTTETRGQNSFVNFSGVNDRIEGIRKEARKLRQQGKLAEAQAKVDEIYKVGSFAEQKVGLLPEEFYQIDENFVGDEEFVPAPTIESMLDMDVSNVDNMQSVLNALDRLDQAITNRLRGNANESLLAIPLSTVQVVVKAVKALVQGGMVLRDAIKKVAKDNKLTEKQVTDVMNEVVKQPAYTDLATEGTGIMLTGTEELVKGENLPTASLLRGYQDDYTEQDIMDAEHAPNSRVVTVAQNIADGEVSYTKEGEKKTLKLPYVNKSAAKKIKSLREKYSAIEGSGKDAVAKKQKIKNEINKVAKQVIDDFTNMMTQNLLALYDTLTPEFIKNSKQWYVGANRMANAIAQKYNLTIEQVGGIIAVLSPQNDWFNNVSAAERVIDIMKNRTDEKITKEIVDKVVPYVKRNKGGQKYANTLIDLYEKYGEVSLNDLAKISVDTQMEQAVLLRALDHFYNSPKVAVTDPNGKFIGNSDTVIKWNSNGEISKAISIFKNKNVESINSELGDGNKVRNFYNNIVDPNSSAPYVTADTHALSASLNIPASADDASGIGLFKGGLEPLYALVKSAYIDAANIAGILPREMQSITWEAQRIGINDKKRTNQKKKEVFDNVLQLRNNEQTAYERATEIISKNRSSNPIWGKQFGIETQKTDAEIRKGLGLRSKQRFSQVSSLRGDTGRRMGAAATEMGRGVAGRTIDEVLSLDTKVAGNQNTVLSFLDDIDRKLTKRLLGGANEGLLALPLGTIQVVVKAVKALVKGGMILRDAIAKVAADNNVSESDVIKSLQFVANVREEEGRGVELNEATLPGYDRMMQEIDGIVEKALSRGAEQDRIVNDVISYLQGTKVYENATDTQREALVREARKLFGLREKYAPSAERVLGQTETTVTVNEMAALKDQLRLEARAAREAKSDMNAKRKAIADVIRKLQGQGTITVRKATAMINKLSNLNLYNTEAVERYIDYVGKVFADAEYESKLSTANNIRKQLRKLSKNKDKSANLRSLGSKFVEIDPSMVEDIDEYNKNAALILDSIKGSSIRGSNVRFAEMVRESDAMQYIDKTIKEQQQKLYDMKLAAIQDLLGVDASELNYEQLVELLAKDEPMTKYNESIVRDAIQKAFDVYSAIIKESIKTGKDVFTGEDVEYTDTQKKVVKQFMDMDISALKPKQALEAVDSLMNFLQNQSTAKMDAVVNSYKGEMSARELAEKGIKASPLKKYWSKNLGRFLGEYTTNLNILFEKMFKGFGRGGMVEDKSGVTALKNGKAVGQAQANQIVNEYVKQFYKKKANGESFNTGYNAIERGMLSFMTRNIIGTQEEMNAEFERRKNLVKESIDVLSQGNEQEVEKAKLYQEAYDKLVEGSTTIDEVMSKADPVNMDAVNFWVEQWANKYDELADVSLNVYNKILGQDINYTPDRFSKLSSDTGVVELSNDDMAFHNNNGTIYKKETGVLMSATRPESLPVNPKNGEPNRYIDLSFDKNNANSMYDALVDINTAGPIRQVEAFLNSSSFRKIVPEANDATILKTRINLFTNNIRQKNPYTNDELSKAVRRLNKLAAVGVGQSLGGITQPIKQVIPVAMNTLINGGGLDLGVIFNKSKNDFINRSGYSIANRGIESQAQVESLNKLIDEAANSKGEALIKKIEDLNKWWLKKFLVNPDVFIARASWMTYYEQNLKKQGIDPNTIDYSTHEVNQEAADYAQRMVDRQQNVSDADLAGKLFADKEPTKQVFVKMLMPFASFRMNQASRLGADLGTVMSNVSTKEDKKIAIRSLAGFAVEMATFRMISIGTGVLIAALVKGVMGREDDEEKDQKKLDAIIKGQMTGTVSDVFSPLPLTDRALQMGTSYALDAVQDALNVAEEDKVSIYSGAKQDFVQSLGLFGIAADRALQLYDLASLSAGKSFKDDFGREKFISPDDRDKLGFLIGPALLVNLGLAPSEVNSIVRSSLSDAKRNSSTKEGGGKTKEETKETEKSKEKKMESKEEKIDALKELKRRTIDSDKRRIITEMIEEETMTAEEKKAAKEKMSEEKRQKKLEMEELLGEYDSKSEMKRYNPSLYERTFGENSDYYKENKDEMEVEKELRKLLRKREDKRRGYRPKVK